MIQQQACLIQHRCFTSPEGRESSGRLTMEASPATMEIIAVLYFFVALFYVQCILTKTEMDDVELQNEEI